MIFFFSSSWDEDPNQGDIGGDNWIIYTYIHIVWDNTSTYQKFGEIMLRSHLATSLE